VGNGRYFPIFLYGKVSDRYFFMKYPEDDYELKFARGPMPIIYKNGLEFISPSSRTGAFGAGMCNVFIPYTALKEIIRKNGPLKEFIAQQRIFPRNSLSSCCAAGSYNVCVRIIREVDMSIDALKSAYRAAEKSQSFSQHLDFVNLLLSRDDVEAVKYHFDLLARRENYKLYQRVRAAFKKRETAGEKFLVARSKSERNPALLSDILFLLGLMRSTHAAKIAQQFLDHKDNDCRFNACVVLGWVGSPKGIALLKKRLLEDSQPLIRGAAAAAMRQIYERLPETKDKLLLALKKGFTDERNKEALSLMIVSVQSIAGKKFGLREIVNKGTITGNIIQARDKALEYLSKNI
jgi:hypothetical protein